MSDRQPLSPILARIDLQETDPVGELQDALAELGTVLPRKLILGWTAEQFFEALHYARAMQARLEPLPDVPEKPSFIP